MTLEGTSQRWTLRGQGEPHHLSSYIGLLGSQMPVSHYGHTPRDGPRAAPRTAFAPSKAPRSRTVAPRAASAASWHMGATATSRATLGACCDDWDVVLLRRAADLRIAR